MGLELLESLNFTPAKTLWMRDWVSGWKIPWDAYTATCGCLCSVYKCIYSLIQIYCFKKVPEYLMVKLGCGIMHLNTIIKWWWWLTTSWYDCTEVIELDVYMRLLNWMYNTCTWGVWLWTQKYIHLLSWDLDLITSFPINLIFK